jgi:hypothetical protein
MLFWNRQAREAREFARQVRAELVDVLEQCTGAVEDARFRADKALGGRLAEGDVQEVQRVLRAAEDNLDACRRALAMLEEYERSGDVEPTEFSSLKPLLLHEDEDARDVFFDTAPEVVRWVGGRALEFGRYVRDTQVPWLEEALGTVRDAAASTDDIVAQAEQRRQEALDLLKQIGSEHPQVSLAYSEDAAASMEELYQELQAAKQRRVYAEVQDAAQRLGEAAEAVINSAEEAVAFYRDPQEKVMEGRAFLDRLEEEYRRQRLELPEVFYEAQRTLEEARREAAQPQPNWDEAIRLYNHASGLAAEAADLLEEGH